MDGGATTGVREQCLEVAEAAANAGFAELRMASIMVGYSAFNNSPLFSTAAAPAPRMAVTVWSGTPAVSPTTAVDGLSSLINRVASMPLIVGKLMSMMTTVGLSFML